MPQLALARNARPVALAAERHLAPAKVNLALHVTGRRPDGYHLLSSLVAFADVGDRLTIAPSEGDAFQLRGPFAEALGSSLAPGATNSVAAALSFARSVLRERDRALLPVHVVLEKNLPVASGIGGGSADAAAILRLAASACPDLASTLSEASVRLGADVPMCVAAQAALVAGIGETMRVVSAFPDLPAVLVNPGVPVSTPAVFRAMNDPNNPPLPKPERLTDLRDVLDYLNETRNDLEAPAIGLAPSIAEARILLADACALFARMSGSGATVFGLFANEAVAQRAAKTIGARHPSWWVRPTVLGSVREFGA